MTLPDGVSATMWSAFTLFGASFILLLFAITIPSIAAAALGGSAIPGYALMSQIMSVATMFRLSSAATQINRAVVGTTQAALPPSPAVAQTLALQRATRNLVAARRARYE
jgi:hypothetical protein